MHVHFNVNAQMAKGARNASLQGLRLYHEARNVFGSQSNRLVCTPDGWIRKRPYALKTLNSLIKEIKVGLLN